MFFFIIPPAEVGQTECIQGNQRDLYKGINTIALYYQEMILINLSVDWHRRQYFRLHPPKLHSGHRWGELRCFCYILTEKWLMLTMILWIGFISSQPNQNKKRVECSQILVSFGYKTPSKMCHKEIKCKVLLYDAIFSIIHSFLCSHYKVVPPVASVISFLPRVVIWWSQLRRDENWMLCRETSLWTQP